MWGNVIFDDLSVSERIRLLSSRYNEDKSSERIMRLEQEYGMSSRHIARYVRCDRLLPKFKEMLDEGTLTIAAGVDVSFLSEAEQTAVLDVMEQNSIKLSRETAKKLRMSVGSLTIERITRDWVGSVNLKLNVERR